jgi:hypothetical protein
VAEAWRAEQQEQQAKRLADELADALRNGRELTSLAKEKQLKGVTTPPFTRNGEAAAPDLSRAAVAALFEAKPGETVTVPVQSGFVVARLTSVLPPALDTVATSQAALRSELTEALRDDIVAQFAAGLRSRYSVKVNPRVLESL